MVRPECQRILDTISDKKADLVQFQLDLQAAPTYEMQTDAASEIKKLNAEIRRLERDFNECEGLPNLPDPIGALFPCRVFAGTSNSTFSFLSSGSIAAGMFFSQAAHASVQFFFPDSPVGTFACMVGSASIPANVVSARLNAPASGSFERSTGHIDLPMVSFTVDHSSPFLVDSTVVFVPLTTRTVPSALSPVGTLTGFPLNRGATPGRVVLVGSSTLAGGNFAGTVVDITIYGTLSQFPP
jgi:hypothetical protein